LSKHSGLGEFGRRHFLSSSEIDTGGRPSFKIYGSQATVVLNPVIKVITYDSNGDITAIADQSMTYDQTGRHLTTTSNTSTAGPTGTVAYLRDVTGTAIQMSTTIGTGAATTVD
jgi:hypothetical protein